MIEFTLFGIPVRVQPFFWISLVIIGGALDANSAAAIFHIVLFTLAGFISILVHEFGHALTARRFGAVSEITLEAFGGYASYSGVRLSRGQSFLVTAAGPAVQILLGVAVFLALRSIPGGMLTLNAFYFLKILMGISLVWAILNLLPVLPLDGGRMLEAMLGPQRIRVTLWVSMIVAISIALTLYLSTRSILFPMFLGFFAWQAYQGLRDSR